MTRAARALEIACDRRKQKLYRLNRPIQRYHSRIRLFRISLILSVARFSRTFYCNRCETTLKHCENKHCVYIYVFVQFYLKTKS